MLAGRTALVGRLALPVGRLALLVAAIVGVGIAGCSSDKSFVVVSVYTAGGDIPGVAQLVVTARNGGSRDQLFYPKARKAALRLTAGTPVTLSVSFSPSLSGPFEVGVVPVDTSGAILGFGSGMVGIVQKDVAHVDVRVVAGVLPEDWARPPTGDGGVGDDGGGPVKQLCEPAAPSVCGPDQTCFVDCAGSGGAAICTPGGRLEAGEACRGQEDCAPGLQCFEYGCGLRLCLRFCTSDAVCGGGRCSAAVRCGEAPTRFQRCTLPCDPRGEATQGCPAPLRCLLSVPSEIADCGCVGPGQTGVDGAACDKGDECAPGFLCIEEAGTKKKLCRKLCKLSDGSPTACPADRTCRALQNPALETYGACEP